jgi:hypothetical protein
VTPVSSAPEVALEIVAAGVRALSKRVHPDRPDGSHEGMTRLMATADRLPRCHRLRLADDRRPATTATRREPPPAAAESTYRAEEARARLPHAADLVHPRQRAPVGAAMSEAQQCEHELEWESAGLATRTTPATWAWNAGNVGAGLRRS